MTTRPSRRTIVALFVAAACLIPAVVPASAQLTADAGNHDIGQNPSAATVEKDGDVEMTTTTNAAPGASPKDNPHGVRIVEVYPDRIEQKFYAYEDLPEQVAMKDK